MRRVAVAPSNTSIVYAFGRVSGTNALYKTVNGGSSWDRIQLTGFSDVVVDMEVHPDNPSVIAVTSKSGLYQSADGGVSWAKVSTGFSSGRAVYHSRMLGGLVIATNKGIWIWKDWAGTPSYFGADPATPNVNCFIDTDDYLFAGTRTRAVWFSKYVAGIADKELVDVTSVVRISPNPVRNGSAVVQFALPRTGATTITVHDLSGRAVMTVASGIISAGSHGISLDASKLLPGVHFINVQNEATSMSARFVVSR